MKNGTAAVRAPQPVGEITIPPKAKDLAGKFKIKIHEFHIAGNGSVRFVNKTEDIVSIWIPDGGSLFAGAAYNDIRFDLPAHGENTLSVLADAENGDYRYSAYCHEIRDFAEGGSAPEIHCP